MRTKVRVDRLFHWGPLFVRVAVMFSVATLFINSAAATQDFGVLRGFVKVEMVPDTVMVDVEADQGVCGDQIEDQTTLVDSSGGVANVVVIVNGLQWINDPPSPTINNQKCFFEPRVQVVKTRSQIDISSEDQTLHSTHAYDDRQRTMFNVAIPFPGLNIQRPLRRPGVVRVECDSHSWMRGWIYVTDDVGAVTGLDGTFEIPEIPPGTYDLTIWHERYQDQMHSITVTSGQTTEVNMILQQ